MQLARGVGSVVSTQKSPTLIGKKLLLVRRVAGDGSLPPDSNTPDEVAVDFCVETTEPTTRASCMIYSCLNS